MTRRTQSPDREVAVSNIARFCMRSAIYIASVSVKLLNDRIKPLFAN